MSAGVITNLKGIQKRFNQLALLNPNIDVIVGYTAKYAAAVHETNREYRVGQWKFLEEPARVYRKELISIVVSAYKTTGDFESALLLAALRLKRISQEDYVPVATGHLKGTAFIEVE